MLPYSKRTGSFFFLQTGKLVYRTPNLKAGSMPTADSVEREFLFYERHEARFMGLRILWPRKAATFRHVDVSSSSSPSPNSGSSAQVQGWTVRAFHSHLRLKLDVGEL